MVTKSKEDRLRRRRLANKLYAMGRPTYVPVGPSREKLTELIKVISLRKLAAETGITEDRLNGIYKENKASVRREDHDIIMAYRVDEALFSEDWRRTGASRIMRGLVQAGWPGPYVAKRVGVCDSLVRKWRSPGEHKWPSQVLYVKLVELAQSLESVDPETVLDLRTVRSVRARAANNGYEPLACWDWDTIGDPDVNPEWTGFCGSTAGYHAHKRMDLPVCASCREAYSALRREEKAAKREGRSVAPRESPFASGWRVGLDDPVVIDRIMADELREMSRAKMARKYNMSLGVISRFIYAEKKRRGLFENLGRTHDTASHND